MALQKGQISKFFVGALMLLLVVGLAGFGSRNFGGGTLSLGTVGKVEIDANTYARALTQELQALSAQSGRTISLQQAQQFGVDQQVLQRLINGAALENENLRLGLSVGDNEVQRQVLAGSSFQGLDGKFDRDAYEYSLQRAGLTPRQFEGTIRADTAANILQVAVGTGFNVPETYADIMLNYIAEQRSFSWLDLSERDLSAPIPEPTNDELQTYYSEHPDQFMLPVTKQLTYAWLSPDDVMGQVEVSEDTLHALYDERSDIYNTPERRLVERLIFPTAEEAQTAWDSINAGDTSFEDVVAARGLTLADIDLGDMSESEMGDAGSTVFALTDTGVAPPVETDLGPALIRVNAILSARSTPFEEAREELRTEQASDAARRLVADQIAELDDLLAGGATLEELSSETDMALGQLDWVTGETEAGIAAYETFQSAAKQAQDGDFPQISELSDGGIFALRLDDTLPERPQPFDLAQEEIRAAWRAKTLNDQLLALAEPLMEQLDNGASLSSLGYPATVQTNVTRDAFIKDTPPDFMAEVFNLDGGKSLMSDGGNHVVIAQLSGITPPDPQDERNQTIRTAINDDINQSLGQDALAAFGTALQRQASLSINQAAVNAVHAQFTQSLGAPGGTGN